MKDIYLEEDFAIEEDKEVLDSFMIGGYDHQSDYNVNMINCIGKELRKEISEKYKFELIDEITRNNIRKEIELHLENLCLQRVIYKYDIKLDEENNPPDIISNNKIVIDIMIKFNLNFHSYNRIRLII